MYYMSEAKLINSKTDLLKHYETKSQPDILVTRLMSVDNNGFQATFQRAMRLTVTIGQFFGLNPVIGVSEIDTIKLRQVHAWFNLITTKSWLFKFVHDPKMYTPMPEGLTLLFKQSTSGSRGLFKRKRTAERKTSSLIIKFQVQSWRFAYSFVSIILQSMLVCFAFLNLFTDSNRDLSANASLVFCTINCVTTILFLRVAMKWPGLCQYISKTEASDPSVDRNLIKKCNISCLVVLILAAMEHALSDLSGLAGAIDCQKGKNLFEAFSVSSFPWMFEYIRYSPYMGVLAQFINLQFTFNWNFSDVFVICISFYLTSRLEQVNRRIVAAHGRHTPSSFWRGAREDYSRVTGLVRRVDDVIGGVIFISFANNVFFICLQLLHTLTPLKGYEQTVYFVYSFGFLISRSLAVSLIGSQVHSASRGPARSLYCVPSTAYCVEVQRFLDQVHSDTIALSGLKFFNVKRGLVLTIAGTIVTYELVLMQFTGVTPKPSSTIAVPISINISKV